MTLIIKKTGRTKTTDYRSDPRLLKARRIQEYYVRNRIASRWGITLSEFEAMCDLGEIEGLEPFFELEAIWNGQS